MWLVAGITGVLAVATTALPWHDAVDTTQRVAPVLGFLAAITVLARLSDEAGLFDVVARSTARLSGGGTRTLLLIVCALATATTVGLSLDTTAVLFTPVVLALAAAVGADPRPFAYATIWLANGASLLLPVSNLTNLLALDRLGGIGTLGFAARMALPELAVVVVIIPLLLLRFRSSLRGRHAPPAPYRASDRVLLALAAVCCLAVAPASLAGIAPWQVATPAAVVLTGGFWLRGNRQNVLRALPVKLLVLTEGLFLTVTALGRHGLDELLRHTTTHGSWVVEIIGAATGNVVNNLPAYLALERAVPGGQQQSLFALLIGTNAGPMLLVTGSLATLLWRDRCRARGLHIGAWEFTKMGLLVVPPMLALAYVGLLLGPA